MNNARHQHSCTLDYNEKSYERRRNEIKEQPEGEKDGDIIKRSTRKSEGHNLGELKYCFCPKFDKMENLHAGKKHATKREADDSHVKVTETWKKWLVFLPMRICYRNYQLGM